MRSESTGLGSQTELRLFFLCRHELLFCTIYYCHYLLCMHKKTVPGTLDGGVRWVGNEGD